MNLAGECFLVILVVLGALGERFSKSLRSDEEEDERTARMDEGD
jgi:hypothetical protein